MKLIKEAMAGTLESGDLLVKVAPGENLDIVIHSLVLSRFGKQIRHVVSETLDRLSVNAGSIIIEDKGALDCVIKARVQAAVLRGAACVQLDLEALL